jgi:hypothetical protein
MVLNQAEESEEWWSVWILQEEPKGNQYEMAGNKGQSGKKKQEK